MDKHAVSLRTLFEKQSPHTVNPAIDMIEGETGIRFKPSACRAFLKKLGMKFRKCGLTPGKVADDAELQ
ncbi:MAG: hypothetical protein ACU837_07020 [Gammaproteobacteria bacterium]